MIKKRINLEIEFERMIVDLLHHVIVTLPYINYAITKIQKIQLTFILLIKFFIFMIFNMLFDISISLT